MLMEWMTEAKHTTRAPANAIWKLWSDVATWPDWDFGLESVTLDGPFEQGARGRLKPKGGPRFRYTLTRVETDVGFDDETRVPGAKIRFSHRIEDAPDGSRVVTHRAQITGILTPLWVRIMGSDLVKELPAVVAELVTRAEAAS